VDNYITGVEEDNSAIRMKRVGLKSSTDTAYFRIRKHQNNFKLFYSEDGINWTLATSLSNNEFFAEYEKCELFFTAISDSTMQSTVGDFSDFSIKYLQ
jgi:hypothetical protein